MALIASLDFAMSIIEMQLRSFFQKPPLEGKNPVGRVYSLCEPWHHIAKRLDLTQQMPDGIDEQLGFETAVIGTVLDQYPPTRSLEGRRLQSRTTVRTRFGPGN